MWTINSRKIIDRFKGSGGEPFTEFVDSLIRAEAFLQTIPQSEISTNLRTNLGDKGVDTEVRQAIPNTKTGWLEVPTCWQYKATEFRNISETDLRAEVNKSYALDLISKAYSYRFCICDDLTPAKRNEWEEILKDEIRKLNPSAPQPRVVTASDLAVWVSQFPAAIVRFFKPQLERVFDVKAWGEMITQVTPQFVDVEAWATIQKRLTAHANLNNSCNSVILTIEGEAGVGKTRLVYESLLEIEGASNLIVRAIDEKALEIAYLLAGDKTTKLILVADECLPKTQLRLKEILDPARDRVRVICIDNSGERFRSATSQLWLERIPEKNVDDILRQNFPSVPPNRRRAYANSSKGFVKFAADLCQQDNLIALQGNFNSTFRDVWGYLKTRLQNDEEKLRVIKALSLFRKVGYRAEVKDELESLCAIETLRLNKNQTLDIAQQLKDVPGFVAFAGRYLYITPEIIAQVAFERAWKQWIDYDPSAFLKRIPASLLPSFLDRVLTSSSKEVCRTVGNFFRTWATQLKPTDLSNASQVNCLVVLAEIYPDDYLAILVRLIEIAPSDRLLETSTGCTEIRRSLVWLAERVAAFPEYFAHAESILWNLALAETERDLANNATYIWQQLYRIFMSGTATPYCDRMDLLKQRLFSEDEQQISLALKCLTQAFDTKGSRTVGSFMIAGRIPPEDWEPKTQLELEQCLDKALEVLSQAAASPLPMLREGAMNVAIQRLPTLLDYGYFEQVQTLFTVETLPETILLSLIRAIEDIIQIHPDTSPAVKEWLHQLIPATFHGKLLEIIGGKFVYYSLSSGNQEAWQNEVHALARQLCDNLDLLKREIDWLFSPQAASAWALGNAMGLYDSRAICLEVIMRALQKTKETGLAADYIGCLVREYPQHIDAVNTWIDKLEIQMPEVAYHLFRAGGDATQAVQRTLKLVDRNQLSLAYLKSFAVDVFRRTLTEEQFCNIVERLLSAMKEGKLEPAVSVAINFAYYRLKEAPESENFSLELSQAIQNQIWEILELSMNHRWSESLLWGQILQKMKKIDLNRAVEIATLALISESNSQREDAEKLLTKLARSKPELILKKLGHLLLNEKYRWQFSRENYRSFIQAFPVETMKKWLDSIGEFGAQSIASHLPIPYLNERGEPIVPPLTEFVLSKFQDDEETFEAFCRGSQPRVGWIEMGGMALAEREKVEVARKFSTHPLRRIRDWAIYEIQVCEEQIDLYQQIDEETALLW